MAQSVSMDGAGHVGDAPTCTVNSFDIVHHAFSHVSIYVVVVVGANVAGASSILDLPKTPIHGISHFSAYLT